MIERLPVVAAVLLLACNDKPGTSPKPAPTAATATAPGTPGSRDACTLLTAAQIEGAIGTPVLKTVPYGTAECRWSVKPLSAFADADEPWVDVQFANEQQMTSIEAAPGTKGVVAIAGLGDRAFRTNSHDHVWVKRGADVFIVKSRLQKVGRLDEAARPVIDEVEMRLARLVIEHL